VRGAPLLFFTCERCGVGVCCACYWTFTPAAEFAFIDHLDETEADAIAAGTDKYIFPCAACRS